ncbi:MAG: Gfo/Idh/MocA family protein [Nocardioidaceae bacterium]
MDDARRERDRIGVAVVGAGRMGTHRARLAATHPAVDFLAVADVDPTRAEQLAEQTEAQLATADPGEAIHDERVNSVIVSTPEPDHAAPAIAAIRAGKPVLIEKPIATTRADADAIITAAKEHDVTVRIGYSQRYRRDVFLGKRYIDEGRLGRVVGGANRVLNSRAQAFAIFERTKVSPVVDVLTYWLDVMGWYLDGNPPVEVYAAGHGTVLRERTGPDGPDDITTAVVRHADGAVMSYTICYSLPADFPTLGQGIRLEVFGTEGTLLLDLDNRQNVIFSEHGVDHPYVRDHTKQMGYVGSTTSGDWALGRMFGPLADETRAWLDHLATGSELQITTPEQARWALEVALAMETAATSGQPERVAPVSVPLLR